MITTCIRDGRPIAWVPIRTIYAGEPRTSGRWPISAASSASSARPAATSGRR